MKFHDELKILLIISFISLFLDISLSKKKYNKCIANAKFMPFLYVHHVISVFTLTGWLSSNKKILILYIVTLIVIFAHWKTNNNKCFSTDYINEMCEIKILFRDLYHFLGLKDQMETLCGIFAFISFVKICTM